MIWTLHNCICILFPPTSKGPHVCPQHVDDSRNKITLTHPSAVVGIFLFNYALNTACRRAPHPAHAITYSSFNRLTPNDTYMGRTAPLTSKRCISYIYSTNIGTEYFKHALYSPFFSLQNAVCFIMLTCLVPVLFTFYTQSVLKLKKK